MSAARTTIDGMAAEERWVEELDVEVITHRLNGLHGAYLHDHRIILLDERLAPIQRRSTLMRELGHAYYGHTDSTARAEHEASEWAARALIRGCDFMHLTTVYDHPQSIASELGVLPRDVLNFWKWATG